MAARKNSNGQDFYDKAKKRQDPDNYAMYFRGLPKFAQHWLRYQAPTDFTSISMYKVYRNSGKVGLAETCVGASIYSVIKIYNTVDVEDIKAMISGEVYSMVNPERFRQLVIQSANRVMKEAQNV